MDFEYYSSEEIEVGGYIYFYKYDEIVAVYNPFVGLCVKKRTLT